MREPEIPPEESEALQDVRRWRSAERKKMVDDIEKLISQAQRLAVSQYTRSAQRAKWTRLAGQLIWYKDQILRAMTWEALEQDLNRLGRRVEEYTKQRPQIVRTWGPTVIRKKEDAENKASDSETKPEDAYNSSGDKNQGSKSPFAA